jgi:hypothetical protein
MCDPGAGAPAVGQTLPSSGRYELFYDCRPQPESQQKLGEVHLPGDIGSKSEWKAAEDFQYSIDLLYFLFLVL